MPARETLLFKICLVTPSMFKVIGYACVHHIQGTQINLFDCFTPLHGI